MRTKSISATQSTGGGVQTTQQDHMRGPLGAPLTLIEYGDYQCPYCAQAHQTVLELIERFGPRLCYIYRNFPLTEIHENAEHAAEAAEAGAMRGKFWEMHDALFENQEALDDASLAEYARDVGLDPEEILEEIESGKHARRIKGDFESGVRNGVNGTPAFFVNGKRYQGEDDLESLTTALEEAERM
jgi:protein-disulfide isomerase